MKLCSSPTLSHTRAPAVTLQAIAALWTLLSDGVHGRRPTCVRPLVLCPASLVANWGKELEFWCVRGGGTHGRSPQRAYVLLQQHRQVAR